MPHQTLILAFFRGRFRVIYSYLKFSVIFYFFFLTGYNDLATFFTSIFCSKLITLVFFSRWFITNKNNIISILRNRFYEQS